MTHCKQILACTTFPQLYTSLLAVLGLVLYTKSSSAQLVARFQAALLWLEGSLQSQGHSSFAPLLWRFADVHILSLSPPHPFFSLPVSLPPLSMTLFFSLILDLHSHP